MVAESEVMTGTMVAAKGMLSTKAEAMPDSHRMMMTMRVRLPPVMWAMPWAMASSTPVCSRPLTARKRPMKKRTVCQSTRLSSRMGSLFTSRVRTAAITPTMATVRPVLAWVMSRMTVRRNTPTFRANLRQLWMDALGSISMAFCRAASSWVATCLRKAK